MKTAVLIALIALQMVVAIALGFKIIEKRKAVLGAVNVAVLRRADYAFPDASTDGALKYFYQPKPNTSRSGVDTSIDFRPSYTVTINADGLNALRNYTPEKPANTFRIIALGDSYTYGLWVNTEDNWPSLLERDLTQRCYGKHFEVINLGVGGYDIQYAVERYRLKGMKYDPDLVVWFLKDDDFNSINELMQQKAMQYQREMTADGTLQRARENGHYYPQYAKAAQDALRAIGEKNFYTTVANNLARFNDYYQKSLVLMTFQTTNEPYKEMMHGFIQTRKDASLFDTLSDTQTIVGDHFPDAHPTASGYKLIENELVQYLTTNRLIACQ